MARRRDQARGGLKPPSFWRIGTFRTPFAFQKVPKCDWHGPRSHINHVLPIKTADQVPAQVVQTGIEDDGNPRPLFVVAKNLTVANYGDILAGLRIDNIAMEHVFLFCVSDVRLQLRIRRVVPVAVLSSVGAARWRAHSVRCPLSDALDCLRAVQAARALHRGKAHRRARRTPN
jgi:hypothetical protein